MLFVLFEQKREAFDHTEKGHALLAQIQQWPHWEEIGKVAFKEYAMTLEQ
jgi:hypothetical protein